MRTSGFLVLAVILIIGTLAAQAAVVAAPRKGQDAVQGHVLDRDRDPIVGRVPVKGQDPVKGPSIKSGSCPDIKIRCAMLNPPDRCHSDSECQGAKKCCVGACGRACLDPQ
ncbi:elafin-like [Tupaia chinensis]|uniref:elafin-like n=1 Tax=Tupaia chinensis TaxID=246437 RepID=UPI000704748F|nr:elafin-like [Tupaia chinensis]